MKKSKPIFKKDSAGKTRFWWYEVMHEGDRAFFRTVSGLVDGKSVTSKWREAEPKNVGRANETDAWMQAQLEAQSAETHRLERGYFKEVEDIGTFARTFPMTAKTYAPKAVNFTSSTVFSQPKLDGIRCIARADGLWSRQGKEIVSVPHIFEAVKGFLKANPGWALDGELYNHDLKNNFNKITSLVRKTKPTAADIEETASVVEYHVYDLIPLDNQPARFNERSAIIHAALLKIPGIEVVRTLAVNDSEKLDALFGEYMEQGYEGQMVRIDQPYEQNKRSNSLLKRKEFITEEFSVSSVEEGKGNWSRHVKRFILSLPSGIECGAGVRGTQDTLRELLECGEKPDWATVRHFGYTPDGKLRFPVVIDWGYGKRTD